MNNEPCILEILVILLSSFTLPWVVYKIIYIITTEKWERIADYHESKTRKTYKKKLEARRAERRKQVALQESQKRNQEIKTTTYGITRDHLTP